MSRKLLPALALGLSVLIVEPAPAAKPLPPADQWIPREAIVAFELSKPKAVLDLALDPDLVKTITSSPAYQRQASKPDFQQMLNLVKYLETKLRTDWQTALHKLLDGGVTFAVGPNNATLLTVDAEDGRMLQQTHDIFRDIAKGEAEKSGHPQRVASEEYRGVTGWTFNGKETHAIVGKRLLVANNSEVLKAVADIRAKPGSRSLASSSRYQAAKKAVGTGSAGMAFVDIETLKQHSPLKKALAPAGNPLVVLLLAGLQENLRESSWLGAGLDVQKNALALRLAMDAKVKASGPTSYTEPGRAGKGALPNLSVPRRIAAMSVYRDLHKFYSAKNELFPERTSGLIFFENMMGIFFSGRDLTDEVLAEVGPEIRVVVAEQAYDPSIGTPQVRFPAFAAVFRMDNPKKFGEVVEEAWQKAIGLVNFTRGQKALPGLIIDRATHRDTKLTVAYFSATDEKDKKSLDVRFNLRPTLACFGDHLILSSTDGLAKDVIDALSKEAARPVKPMPGIHSLVELDSVRLATTLGANRENLIRQNMLEGNTREQAETHVDIILTVLEYLGQARLIVGTRNGRPSARLDLWPNLQ